MKGKDDHDADTYVWLKKDSSITLKASDGRTKEEIKSQFLQQKPDAIIAHMRIGIFGGEPVWEVLRRALDPQPRHRHRSASDASYGWANRLVAGRKVDRRRRAPVGRSRSRTGRIAPHEAAGVGDQRRRRELLAQPRRLYAHRRMRRRHRPRGRQERAPAHTSLLTVDSDADFRFD